MYRRGTIRLLSGLAAVLWFMAMTAVLLPIQASAASISINSPANGQEFSGNGFKLSGVTESNAAVAILHGGKVIAQTRSDSSGNWSVNLDSLPDGPNTITAKAIKNSGYGYFGSTADGGVTIKLNQFSLVDNTINPNAPYPVTISNPYLVLIPSPVGTDVMTTTGPSTIGTAKFTFAAPTDPALTSSYPSNPGATVGAYTADGQKYYSVNNALGTVSVVDVATNTVTQNITMASTPVTAWRGPSGKIYVTVDGQKIQIIDPDTNTIVETINVDCTNTNVVTSLTFSQDTTYPYYFTFCYSETAPRVVKLKLSDNSQVASWQVPDYAATNGILNLDNSKLYLSSSALTGSPVANKIPVLDAETGAVTTTLTTTSGVVGFGPSPDLQHIYAATPGAAWDQTGFDIIDMLTNTVSHINFGGVIPIILTASSSVVTADVNVSVVLGVKTANGAGGGSLAETGVIAVSTTLLLGLILGSLAYTFYDYERHKRPLMAVDPGARHSYTYTHHLRTVTFPVLRYRVRLSMERASDHDDIIQKF